MEVEYKRFTNSSRMQLIKTVHEIYVHVVDTMRGITTVHEIYVVDMMRGICFIPFNST